MSGPPDPATTEWVPIWNPTTEGPVGPAGPPGPAGSAVAHHVTHETGGTDAIAALAGGVITTGTIADARLSANIPRLNAANTFTANQAITGTLGVSSTITERGRALPVGVWQDYATVLSCPTAGVTFAATSRDTGYAQSGTTLFLRVNFDGGTVSGGSPTEVRFTIPAGFTLVKTFQVPVWLIINGANEVGWMMAIGGTNYIRILRPTFGAIPSGATLLVYGYLICEVTGG
jgi:hypothetical protein